MNRNEFNEVQRLVIKIERVDSLLEYKKLYSLNFFPVDKPEESDYEPVEEQIMWEDNLQKFIRSGIESYRVYLIDRLGELGVKYDE